MPIGTMRDLMSTMHQDQAQLLVNHNFDPGVLRPYVGQGGRSYMTITNPKTGKPEVMLTNTPSTLTRDAYKLFDDVIQDTLRDELVAFADLRARPGLVYRIPNAMQYTVIQGQTMGDLTRATISMSPTRRSERDRPESDTTLFPLPIIHKDFDYDFRELAVSQRGDMPLDTVTARIAAIKVAEEIEMLTLGTSGTFSYGGGTIYGYTNFPQRSTNTSMTVPTGSNGTTVVNEIIALRQLLINHKHKGPYQIYVNTQWSSVLDTDFSATKGENTLRQRILALDGIAGIKTVPWLTSTHWHLLMVEMSPLNVQAVVGMEVQLVQWQSLDGFMRHYKVMAMQYPRIRPDTAGYSGVAHGSTVAA